MINLELSTTKVKEIFSSFDLIIICKFKINKLGYDGDKSNPKVLTNLITEDKDFQDEFEKIFSNDDIKESNEDYTEETLNDTYLNIEVALARDSEGPEYAKVTKRSQDANGIPIGTSNNNPILDTYLYEVEYQDGHKISLTANITAVNLYLQVNDEDNRHIFFDTIINHRSNVTVL